MIMILYILLALLMFSFCIFAFIACWGMFEDTEVGQIFLERMKKKKEDREEQS